MFQLNAKIALLLNAGTLASFVAASAICGIVLTQTGAAFAQPTNAPPFGNVDFSRSTAFLAFLAQSKGRHVHHVPSGTILEVTSGKITTPTLDVITAPAAPAMTLKYKASQGLYYVEANFISSSGQNYSALVSTGAPNNTSGQITFQDTYNALSLYAQPGTWTLSSLLLLDLNYNVVSYSETQLAALFPSLTIQVTNNGTPDVTPPTITKGKVLTPSVSLSSQPYFEAQLTGKDNLSGLSEVYVTISGGDVNGLQVYGAAFGPVASGSIVAGLDLARFETGTYTIDSYSLCDAADNCTGSSNPSDVQKLFGTTTFQVTN